MKQIELTLFIKKTAQIDSLASIVSKVIREELGLEILGTVEKESKIMATGDKD